MFSNWGSGFIDSWTNPANGPGSSSHYVGFQSLHYNHQNNVNGYGFQMLCAGEADNRFFWRSAWPTLRSWVEMIHTGNIASQTVTSCTGNAGTATILQTARTIGGVSFNGSANIDLPGVNTAGNQNTSGSSASCTGNAATATRTSGQSGYPHAGTGMWAFYNWGGNDGGTSAPSASTYTTGLSVGSNPGDQAYGFQIANNMWNTGLWTRNYNSSFGSWIRLLDSSNYVGYSAFTGNVDGAQFRDANDTTYYLDPASTSILNVVRANSYVQKSASQSLSGTVGCTIDVNAAGIHVLTLAASTTISSFTYNNRTANPSVNTIMLVIKYGGTASITWSNVLWANSVTPTVTGVSGYADVYMLTSYQGTTGVWIGTVVAQG
jgi:hypothetical protein